MLYGYHIWSDIPLIQGKDHDDLHKGHPKDIKGQIVNHALWLQILSEEPLIQLGDNDVLNRGQMLIELNVAKYILRLEVLV